MLTTAGKLVFTGDAGGNLVAYDAVTGTPFWRTHIGYVSNPPTTYVLDDKTVSARRRGEHPGLHSGSTSRPTAPSRLHRASVSIALALCVGACSSGSKASPAAAPGAGTVVYVSNETAGTIAFLDGSTGAVEAQVPVGKRPRGVKLSRDGSRLFVALSGSPIAGPGVDESKLPPADRSADGIGVVNLASRKLVKIYPSGPDPEAFDVSPDGKTLYVSNEDTAAMAVVDLERGAVTKSVPVCGEPEGVTVAPDGRIRARHVRGGQRRGGG